jgi:hypothetical protein
LYGLNILEAVQSRLRDMGVDPTNGTLEDFPGWHRSPFKPEVENAGHAVLVSMLLELVPKLQRLHLFWFSKESLQMPPRSDTSSSLLPSLKSLSLTPCVIEVHPLDEAFFILQLVPNVEVLRLNEDNSLIHRDYSSSQVVRWTLAERPWLQHLSELHLIDTCLTEAGFGNLLSAVGPRLSKVSICRTPGIASYWGDLKIVEFNEVVTALQPWCNTLRELLFTVRWTPEPRPAQHLYGVNLLRGFQALEVLRVQSACLDFYGQLGFPETTLTSTLPDSIRELSLLGYGNLVPGLQGLLDHFKGSNFGGLRRIEIDNKGVGSTQECQRQSRS